MRKDTEQSAQNQRTTWEGVEKAEHANVRGEDKEEGRKNVSCSAGGWSGSSRGDTLLQHRRVQSRSVTPRHATSRLEAHHQQRCAARPGGKPAPNPR